jgi:toxin-antitoxin system PIN domain toxin
MISFFPDLNVWLALSYAKHSHRSEAWRWLDGLPLDCALLLSRYTQLGLLRLLTNSAVMGVDALTLDQAWTSYDHWIEDPRVEFHPEPRDIDTVFREITRPFAAQRASKLIGDCYLLAFAKEIGATLVTFDKALLSLARQHHYGAIIPG